MSDPLDRTLCANGDGNPICPPSKVICRACMDRISATLQALVEDRCANQHPRNYGVCTRDRGHKGECFYG